MIVNSIALTNTYMSFATVIVMMACIGMEEHIFFASHVLPLPIPEYFYGKS